MVMLRQIVKPMVPLCWRVRMYRAYHYMMNAWSTYYAHSQLLGPTASIRLLCDGSLRFTRGRPGNPNRIRRVLLKGYKYPFFYREGTSDADVIRQIFLQEEYACAAEWPSIHTILDCGANIGCTAFYLLHRYPKARLIAVEPDAGNFHLCRKNLRPFKERAICVNAAVWVDSVPLRMLRGTFRDGREWSFQVGPCEDGEIPDCKAMTINELMAFGQFTKIDLLKMDIEGAEKKLFSNPKSYKNWLKDTRNIVIELHGADCEDVYAKAVGRHEWEFGSHGELTYCKRKTSSFEVVESNLAPA